MADTPASDPSAFAARLVTGRLTAPGVIDRSALQRSVDRLSRPANAHAIERLRRRAVPTTAGSDPLVLVHAVRGDGVGASPLPGATATASAPARSGAPASPAPGGPGAAVARILARQVVGVGRAAERVAARLTNPAAVSGGAPLVARLAARGNQGGGTSRPSLTAPGGVTGHVLQRSAATPDAPRADAADAARSVVRPGRAPTGAGRVEPSIASPSPLVQRSAERPAPRRASDAAPSASDRQLVAPEAVAPAVAPIQRAALTVPRGDGGGPLTPSPSPFDGAGPSVPLLLRRPARSSAQQSQKRAPSIAARTTGVVARTEAGPVPGPAPSAAPGVAGYSWPAADVLDMEWIVEQVGSRLARRLEVERERQGIREWRQRS